jgi:hypothetical protein
VPIGAFYGVLIIFKTVLEGATAPIKRFKEARVKFIKIMVLLCVAASLPYAKDMVLTTLQGEEIILKEDNTWVFKDGKRNDLESDFTVPVSGGKIVLIMADGSWGYTKEEIIDERVLIPADSVTGRATATSTDVAVATNKAQKQALDQVIARMRVALKKVKIDQTKFVDCVKRVEKDVDKTEDFKKGAGWTVSIAIKCDRGSILAVADCAMKQKKDTTATAEKPPAGQAK